MTSIRVAYMAGSWLLGLCGLVRSSASPLPERIRRRARLTSELILIEVRLSAHKDPTWRTRIEIPPRPAPAP